MVKTTEQKKRKEKEDVLCDDQEKEESFYFSFCGKNRLLSFLLAARSDSFTFVMCFSNLLFFCSRSCFCDHAREVN
jgi:hypothetical protein